MTGPPAPARRGRSSCESRHREGRPGGRDRQRRRRLHGGARGPGDLRGELHAGAASRLRPPVSIRPRPSSRWATSRQTRSTTGPGPPGASRSRSTSPATTPTSTATTATTPPWRSPSRRTAGPRCSREIRSATPPTLFTGVDRFTYTFCDIVDANGEKDCDSGRHRYRRQAAGGPEDRLGRPRGLPPNREVTVEGTTGTCDKAARLTLDSAPGARCR